MPVTPTFQGEVRFAGYTDSSRNGPRVTFHLADRDDLQRFVGQEGRRFAAVLVEIGDDERPAVAESEPPCDDGAPKGGPLAKLAAMWCRDARFRRWLSEQFPDQCATCADDGMTIFNHHEVAAAVVRHVCGVRSRAELDEDRRAATTFHVQIRLPYVSYTTSSDR